MKPWLLIISLTYATYLIKNANSVGEGGQGPKLYKSFDELFGKGWDEENNDSKDLNCRHVKEEVQDEQAPNTSNQKNIEAEILKQKFDEIYAENWSEDDNNSVPSPDDLDQNNSKKHLSDQNNSTDQNESVDEQQNESNECEKIKSDQQKCEIIQKFREMKDNYREKNKRAHSTNEWNQIDKKISNDLGVSRSTIYKWIKELGLRKEKKSKFSEFEKREIMVEFIKMKNEYKQKGKYSQKEWDQNISKTIGVSYSTIKKWKKEFGLSHKLLSDKEKMEKLKQYSEIKKSNPKIRDFEIAESLNIGKSTLIQWKKKFKNDVKDENDFSLQNEFDQISPTKISSDQQKRQILRQFDEIKSKCKQAKLKIFSKNELDDKIAKKLGISRKTIYKWKRKFGLSVSKKFSDATKIEILKKYAKIKGKNPKMTNAVIANILNISTDSLRNWKRTI